MCPATVGQVVLLPRAACRRSTELNMCIRVGAHARADVKCVQLAQAPTDSKALRYRLMINKLSTSGTERCVGR
jgi:hypothetical protein